MDDTKRLNTETNTFSTELLLILPKAITQLNGRTLTSTSEEERSFTTSVTEEKEPRMASSSDNLRPRFEVVAHLMAFSYALIRFLTDHLIGLGKLYF